VTAERHEGVGRVNDQRLNGQAAAAAAVCKILRVALRASALRAPRVAREVLKASASRTRSVICDFAISLLSISVSLGREPSATVGASVWELGDRAHRSGVMLVTLHARALALRRVAVGSKMRR
jgi:hypothetical protein